MLSVVPSRGAAFHGFRYGCPLWVIRDRVEPAAGPAMSALPRKRPTIVSGPHVAKGQKRTLPPDLELSKGGNAYPRHLRWMTLRSA